MKKRAQDAGVWRRLFLSTLLLNGITWTGAQYCPPPETVLPCTCNTIEGELQVWCTFSGLRTLIDAFKSIGSQIQFPIAEMILESNNLPSLPGRTFEGLPVTRLMLRDNGLERVTSNWLASLETSLFELFLVEPRLRTLPDDAFDHLANLEAVTLQGGLIKRSPKFSSLRKLRYLQLYSPALTELFPDNFANLPALEQLHVVGSPHLSKLDAKTMRNLNKVHLVNVSRCALTWIHPKAFAGLPSLRELDLSNNRLLDPTIVGRACKDRLGLQVIHLENNFFDRLSENSFVDLPSLQELYLSQNMIGEVQKGAFKNTPSLKILDLNRNFLKRINPNAFSYLSGSSLEELLLADNGLHSIPEMKGMFAALPRLKIVDLSRNSFEQIPFDTLRGHPTLERIYLDENKIQRVPRKAFSGMASLRELSLRNNSLYDFSGGPYWNLPFLKGLDLSQNQIRRLDSGVLTYLPSLRRLDVSENVIETVMPDTFIGNLDLETVNLSRNYITAFHPLTFNYLPKLFELDVSWNHLREVVPGLPKNVEYLRLNKNQILSLPTEMDLPALRLLDLSGNLLRTVFKRTFRTMSRLRWLYLNDNSIEGVESGAMSELAKLELLNMRNNRLRAFDDTWLVNSNDLKELNVQGNLIESLAPDFMRNNPNLKILQLANNKIAGLPVETFANSRELEELNLANNLLTEFPESFRNLQELRFLDLSHNSIRSLQPFVLQSLPSLRELRMGNNKLSQIPSNAFNDLLNLEYLDLNENEVEAIAGGAFRSLPSLIAVRLSRNRLERLPEETFVDLPELQSAELQFNRIQEIPENAFVHVPHLSYLNLSNNEISRLEKSGIRELKSLEVLDLSLNKVSWIEGRSFYGMEWLVELKMDNNLICNIRGAPFNHLTRLRVLSLRSNRMTSVAEYSFQKLRNNVVVLDVDGNPLSCSCKMLWFLSWLEDLQSEGPRCADGSMFRDAKLSRAECGNSRIVEPVIPGCEGDTVQSSVVETAQLTALTSPHSHQQQQQQQHGNTSQGLLPHETDYFYDEYVEYQYEEVNGTESLKGGLPVQTTEVPVTQKSYHLTTGDTPTLYASSAPPKFNMTNPGLGLTDLKNAQQQQNQHYSGLTFFGIPLPSLTFGNLWKGNSGRSVEETRNPFVVGKVQPVTKKSDGTDPQVFSQPQTESGFVPVVPGRGKFGSPAEGVTDRYHPTVIQGIVTPVQRQSIGKPDGDETGKPRRGTTSTEPYVTRYHLNTELEVPVESGSGVLELGTLPPWSTLSADEPRFTVPDYHPGWNQQSLMTSEVPTTTTTTTTATTQDSFEVPIVTPHLHVDKNNWYFENYNKTNLEPFVGVNSGLEKGEPPFWTVTLAAAFIYLRPLLSMD